jgi:hypothetical protein
VLGWDCAVRTDHSLKLAKKNLNPEELPKDGFSAQKKY